MSFMDLQNFAHASSYVAALLWSAESRRLSITPLMLSHLLVVFSCLQSHADIQRNLTLEHSSSHRSGQLRSSSGLHLTRPISADHPVSQQLPPHEYHFLPPTDVQTRAIRLLDSGFVRLNRSRCSAFKASGCAPIHHCRAIISAMISL